MNKILLVMCLSSLAACVSDKMQSAYVETSEPTFDVDRPTKEQMLLDQEHAAKEEAATSALNMQKFINNKLREDLAFERQKLQKCKDDLADPRLGAYPFRLAIPHLSEDKEQDLEAERKGKHEALKREQKKEKIYQRHLKLTHKGQKDCHKVMRKARVKHGLAPEPYEAKGYFTSKGVWVRTQKGEQNLDDAFAIAAQRRLEKKKQDTHKNK